MPPVLYLTGQHFVPQAVPRVFVHKTNLIRPALRPAAQVTNAFGDSIPLYCIGNAAVHHAVHRRVAPTGLRSGPLLTMASLTRTRLRRLPGFVMFTVAAGASAWVAHPYLLDFARSLLHVNPKDNVTAFQTSFFSFLSLIFAIYSGNTMAFLYDRQKSLMMNLYSETMALEELTEEAIHTLGPDARDVLAQIRVYIDTEIYSPENQSPPLGEGSPLALIRAKARNYRRAGTDVGDILAAAQTLAEKQNERQATAVRLLPAVHWALLYIIGGLFVCTFLLFETGGGFSDEGRHALFAVLCALMTFVLCALRDLADPMQGIYSTTGVLDSRVTYVRSLLEVYETQPPRGVTGIIGGAAVPVDLPEEEDNPAAVGPASSIDNKELLGTQQSLFQVASSMIRRMGTVEATEAEISIDSAADSNGGTPSAHGQSGEAGHQSRRSFRRCQTHHAHEESANLKNSDSPLNDREGSENGAASATR